MPTAYEQLTELVRDANLLHATESLLGWDQEVMMPSGGVAFRGRQLAQLARLGHEMATDRRIVELLAACEGDAALTGDRLSVPAVNVREIRRKYDRRTRLPADLVAEFAKVTSLARHEWAEARKANDFRRFEPHLTKIIELSRERAACYGWPEGGEPWDALSEDFQPGCSAAYVQRVFSPLRPRLVKLVGELMDAPGRPDDSFNHCRLPVEKQEQFVRQVAQCIGFDFSRGRLDRSTHPFCSGTHVHDVRMTTRFHEEKLLDALASTLHESGHAIYEQNLPGRDDDSLIGLPMSDSVSLSIHESQSRLWENQVGRSAAFWHWCQPMLREAFGAEAASYSARRLYEAANVVTPSLIRVEADEATYNLHIMVRFELERALLRGDMTPGDVPGAWNERYRDYLGIDVPDDAHGCLQDIHWSLGAMGYFPTYTLGNLYAAQFFEKASEYLGNLDDQIARGEFGPLREWLTKSIHSHAMRYESEALCEHVTGKPLSADPLMRHLERKLRGVYGLA